MTPQELEKELRGGTIRPFYYFYGEEKLSMDRALEAMRRALFGGKVSPLATITFYGGKEIRADEIVMAAQTFPMLTKRQLITVKMAHEIPPAELKRIIAYLEAPAAFTCLVFMADAIDRKLAFFKALERHGALVEFRPLSERELPRWLQDQAKRAGKELSHEAAASLVELVGSQMEELKGELEKVLLYAGDRRTINAKDIQNVAIDLRSFSVFELVDALGERNAERSLRLLGKMLEAGDQDEPLKILGMIARQLRLIWQAKQLKVQGKTAAAIQKEISVPHWLVEKLLRQGQRFSERELLAGIFLLAQTDLDLKSSRLDSHLIMESLIRNVCRKGIGK